MAGTTVISARTVGNAGSGAWFRGSDVFLTQPAPPRQSLLARRRVRGNSAARSRSTTGKSPADEHRVVHLEHAERAQDQRFARRDGAALQRENDQHNKG